MPFSRPQALWTPSVCYWGGASHFVSYISGKVAEFVIYIYIGWNEGRCTKLVYSCVIERGFESNHCKQSVHFIACWCYIAFFLWRKTSGSELIHSLFSSCIGLTLILLTWKIWWAPTNASKWRMGFNSAFKGLNTDRVILVLLLYFTFEKNLFFKCRFRMGQMCRI